MKVHAWSFVSFFSGTCAVVVTTAAAHAGNTPITPADARQLAKELMESADFVDAMLQEKGLETTNETTH